MPCVTAPAKILITGVNGYVAAHVAKDMLERGFTVVGTVRSTAKGEDAARCFPQYSDRFSYTIVQDISQAGAFDTIIRNGDFDGIAHIAAPVPNSNVGDPSKAHALQDIFNAATEGTLNLLRSIKSHGHTVKRVVLTSSAAAAWHSKPGVKHTEAHWNEESVNMLKEKGNAATAFDHYIASKYLSERAAWDFMEDSRSKVNFDLVTVVPNLIIGIPVNENTSRELLEPANILFSGIKPSAADSKVSDKRFSIIHVKDIAALHSESFIQARAGGHRVMGAAAELDGQDMCDTLNEEPAFPGVPKGQPGVERRSDNESLDWDMTLAKSLLGRNLIGAREALRETAKFYQQKGWEFV